MRTSYLAEVPHENVSRSTAPPIVQPTQTSRRGLAQQQAGGRLDIVSRWHDSLTQTTYLVPDEAVSSSQKHLTSRLIEYLNAHEERQSGRSPHRTGLTAAADGLALFWQEQYPQLIFPLRVTSNRQHPERAFQLTAWEREDDGSYVVQGPWRSKYLGPGSPPLLPASALGVNAPEHLLASDWVLAAAAFAVSAYWSRGARHPENQDVTDEALGALRLGILLLPLWEAVSVSPGPLAEFVRLQKFLRHTGRLGGVINSEQLEAGLDVAGESAAQWLREQIQLARRTGVLLDDPYQQLREILARDGLQKTAPSGPY